MTTHFTQLQKQLPHTCITLDFVHMPKSSLKKCLISNCIHSTFCLIKRKPSNSSHFVVGTTERKAVVMSAEVVEKHMLLVFTNSVIKNTNRCHSKRKVL